MKKNKTQVALAMVSFALAIHGQLALADGPQAAYANGAPVQAAVDPSVYQVNADGAQEDPNQRMSDVARAYRNGYINRGKADDERMAKALAAQHAADMAQLQSSHDPLGYPSEPPPPPPPGTIAVPPPGFAGVPPDYVPPPPRGYAAPPAVVQQVYAPPAQYVPVYPYASYATVQPVITVGASYYGGGYRGYGGWGGGWGGRGRWH
ncbi:hypothetical protein LMG27952_04912 [Paraburkholderia hiiakae]|uniref:DUF4148 domain-containing protein n=1 Tax=Paraburkholderia hiiakae TaxID=1081782 RepID=A0ABN7I5V8_9BURK|nr:hypothetical protein [Paraburkholderia hiiakae]CAD6549777.1 hypothetical protein LMG27952_04912 [Paraburkholderia hiiakae]